MYNEPRDCATTGSTCAVHRESLPKWVTSEDRRRDNLWRTKITNRKEGIIVYED